MRFDHLNFEALKAIREKKIVNSMPSINHLNQLCEACFLGKHVRESFPKEATTRATKELQLVHIIVCLPINSSAFDKNKYFLFIIDNFIMKTWIYFPKKKFWSHLKISKLL